MSYFLCDAVHAGLVYFYFARYIIPGREVSNGGFISALLMVIMVLPALFISICKMLSQVCAEFKTVRPSNFERIILRARGTHLSRVYFQLINDAHFRVHYWLKIKLGTNERPFLSMIYIQFVHAYDNTRDIQPLANHDESVHQITETTFYILLVIIKMSKLSIGVSFLLMDYMITNCIVLTNQSLGGICEAVDKYKYWFIRRVTEGIDIESSTVCNKS